MQSIEQQRKEALEEIYLILAEFFKIPTKGFYEEVANGAIDARLRDLFAAVEYHYPGISLASGFTGFEDMRQNYINCFIGSAKPFAPPIESIYKVWTTDPSAEMAMAKEKGYLYGDSALHIRHLFEHFLLEIPEEYSKMPDHLTLLLEFLGFLIQNGSDDEARQLIIDHFDWLDDFKKELAKVENSSFYIDVTDLIIQATNRELNRLKGNSFLS